MSNNFILFITDATHYKRGLWQLSDAQILTNPTGAVGLHIWTSNQESRPFSHRCTSSATRRRHRLWPLQHTNINHFLFLSCNYMSPVYLWKFTSSLPILKSLTLLNKLHFAFLWKLSHWTGCVSINIARVYLIYIMDYGTDWWNGISANQNLCVSVCICNL